MASELGMDITSSTRQIYFRKLVTILMVWREGIRHQEKRPRIRATQRQAPSEDESIYRWLPRLRLTGRTQKERPSISTSSLLSLPISKASYVSSRRTYPESRPPHSRSSLIPL